MTKSHGPTFPPPDEPRVADLLDRAGPRPALPAEDLATIQRAARAAWEETWVARPARVRRLALAATLAVAVAGAGWWLAAHHGSNQPMASIARSHGAERQRGAGASPAGPGMEVVSDDLISTADSEDSFVTLAMATGASLRLANGTAVRLLGPAEVELERGVAYVDVVAPATDLAVRTALGLVRPRGTQYEVAIGPGVAPQWVRVRVREGTVAVGVGRDRKFEVTAGTELRMDPSGEASRATFAPDHPEWAWVRHAAPPADLEGRTAAEVLRWVCREQGWDLRFGPGAHAVVSSETLHGSSPQGASLEDVLAIVLAATGLEARLEDHTLIVDAAAPPRP